MYYIIITRIGSSAVGDPVGSDWVIENERWANGHRRDFFFFEYWKCTNAVFLSNVPFMRSPERPHRDPVAKRTLLPRVSGVYIIMYV